MDVFFTVPSDNVDIYQYLFNIEVGLREFVIDKLSSLVGQRWYKQKLPNDVLDKYKAGIEIEKKIVWIDFIPHHPLYYIDFTDIKKIIERQDNWNEAFQSIFRRKDIISNMLSKIESIRNKIAHNRKASSADLEIVKTVYHEIIQMIGCDYFHKLINNCSIESTIGEKMISLKNDILRTSEIVSMCKMLDKLESSDIILKSWWFDSTYLGEDLKLIHEYYHLVDEYVKLPRTMGCGYQIQSWIKETRMKENAEQAVDLISKLLQEWRQ
jgi:hypothetical protein